MSITKPPRATSLASTQARQASYRIGQVNAGTFHRNLSLPTFYSDVLVITTCLLVAGWLGLPAAMRTLQLRHQGTSFSADEAANDDRFTA